MNNMIKNPLISCVIPTYKRCDTLVRAINSVLNQTYSNIEVVVVNDNEPDDEYTENLKKALLPFKDDSRVRLVIQEKHVNGAMARNVGIQSSSGEYVGFLDDDDEWEPEKVEKQVRYLATHSDVDGCVCLCRTYYKGAMKWEAAPYTSKNLQFKVLLRQVDVCTPSFLGSKECVMNTPMFNTKLLRHQELQFFVDFLESYKLGVLNEHLVKIHGDDVANRPDLNNIVKRKREWFHEIQGAMKKYSLFDRYRIRCAHSFEVLLVAIRHRNIPYIIKCICFVNIFLPAYIDLIRRVKSRKN